MFITATELKENLSKYLDLAQEEDIYITKYGQAVAKLTGPDTQAKLLVLHELAGILDYQAGDHPTDLEDLKNERLQKQ